MKKNNGIVPTSKIAIITTMAIIFLFLSILAFNSPKVESVLERQFAAFIFFTIAVLFIATVAITLERNRSLREGYENCKSDFMHVLVPLNETISNTTTLNEAKVAIQKILGEKNNRESVMAMEGRIITSIQHIEESTTGEIFLTHLLAIISQMKEFQLKGALADITGFYAIMDSQSQLACKTRDTLTEFFLPEEKKETPS